MCESCANMPSKLDIQTKRKINKREMYPQTKKILKNFKTKVGIYKFWLKNVNTYPKQ